jgi:UDP-GlcNAc:undecaprenyl-phosphate GlcNAc-1-phosphate transferase
MGLILVACLAVSFYLVTVLEILKLRRIDALRLRLARPGITEDEIDADVARALETGEFGSITGEIRAVTGEHRAADGPG